MTQVMGIRHIRDGIENQSVVGADMSVIGIIGTAPAADEDLIPLNTPIEVRTNNRDLLQALGATGTIPDALKAISLQLVTAAAKTVIVRVEDDDDVDEVIENILGSEANGTGMWALLDAPEELSLTPRLIIVPGYTSQTDTGVRTINVTNGGSGYTSAPTVAFTGGGGTGAAGTAVLGTGANEGKVVSVTITNPGQGYSSAPTVGFSGGAGTGAAATAVAGGIANQICVNMPTICSRLKAQFLPEGPTGSRALALNWLESLPQSPTILHPLRQVAVVREGGVNVDKPLSPYIIAAYVVRDTETGGIPSRSAANQSINGIVSVSPRIPLDITNDSSIGMSDIEARFGIVVRGELGVDGSLTDGGFVFWGTDTLSDNTEWQFANVVRMRNYVELGQVKAIRKYTGKNNINLQTVQAVWNVMEEDLSLLTFNKHILGYKLAFEPDANLPDELRLGFFEITMNMEEPAPFRMLTVRSRRYREAQTELVTSISIQLGSALAAA